MVDKNIDSGRRLSCRPASLCNLAGRYDQGMTTYAVVNFIPLVRDYEFNYWIVFFYKFKDFQKFRAAR